MLAESRPPSPAIGLFSAYCLLPSAYSIGTSTLDMVTRWLDALAMEFSYLMAVMVFNGLWLADVVRDKTDTHWYLVDAVLGASYALAVVYQAVRDR